jgi:hypothetical protein
LRCKRRPSPLVPRDPLKGRVSIKTVPDTFVAFRVWTLVDNNDGTMNIISGRRWINRLGYLITQNPWPAGATVEVSLETQPDEEESP